MMWDRISILPRVARLGSRAPGNATVGWGDYWAGVQQTGAGGEVLWDSGSRPELDSYLPLLLPHLDRSLPMVDVGCGNGRFSRWLADYFPTVLGIDLSPAAIRHAEAETAGSHGGAEAGTAGGRGAVTFRSGDLTEPGTGADLATELGEVNVFVRGVFHVLAPAAQLQLASNIGAMLGRRGRLFLTETNFPGGSLDYLISLGATAAGIPAPLERAIVHLPKPGAFGQPGRRRCFPAASWDTVSDGRTTIQAVAMHPGQSDPEAIPGYFAVLACRG